MSIEAPVAISFGYVTVYLVPAGEGCVLVDTGVPGSEQKIFAEMAKLGLLPDAVRLIIVTHAHGDHMGSARAIATRTRAPVLASRLEADAIECGRSLPPVGITWFGRAFAWAMVQGRLDELPAGSECPVVIRVDDDRSLSDFGVAGRVIHTPGHTAGSLSLLLDSGDAYVGDLAAKLPVVGRTYVPFFSDGGRATVYASWRRLLSAGAERIFPAHGKPISADDLRDELRRARSRP